MSHRLLTLDDYALAYALKVVSEAIVGSDFDLGNVSGPFGYSRLARENSSMIVPSSGFERYGLRL